MSEKLNCNLMLFRYTWQKIERRFYQVDSHRIVEIRLRWNNLTPDGVRRMKNLLYVLWKILISEFRKSRVANSSKRLRSNASHKDKICITYAIWHLNLYCLLFFPSLETFRKCLAPFVCCWMELRSNLIK